MMKLEQIPADIAENLCRLITSKLPEYFGLLKVNEHYAQGVRERMNIAAKIDNQFVGLISIEFPYSNSANIYWMAILLEYHNQGIGKTLIEAACELAKDRKAKTITVETLSPKNADENYLKTYNFYLNQDFKPLFDLKPNNYEWKMVYMAKNLEEFHKTTENEDLAIRLLSEADIPIIVNSFAEANWPKPASIFEESLKEQESKERLVWVAYFKDEFAGYITLKFQSKYLPFLEKNIPEINDFNVLPKYRNQGIGLKLLKTAEETAKLKSNIVGIGAGLYADYGAAQKMYIKQGYIPDGLGITYDYKPVEPGKEVKLDDDLILWFTKELFRPLIILITGASGSGKTTVLKELERILPENQVSINYFDDIGVPSFEDMTKEYGACEKWQEAMTHKWLEKLGQIKDKTYIFLEGSFNPEFIKLKDNYLLICIHADRSVREHRLIHDRKQPELATEDMENFALSLRQKTINLGGVVIDSSNKSSSIIADEIINLIETNNENSYR